MLIKIKLCVKHLALRDYLYILNETPRKKVVNKIKVLERKEFKKLSENGQIVKL